jgi:hypothetical protein
VAQAPGRVTVFLVHTAALPRREALDWFLDSLAVARRERRVRLASSAEELLGLAQRP